MAYELKYTPQAENVLNISDTALTLFFIPAILMEFVFFVTIFYQLAYSIAFFEEKKARSKKSIVP